VLHSGKLILLDLRKQRSPKQFFSIQHAML